MHSINEAGEYIEYCLVDTEGTRTSRTRHLDEARGWFEMAQAEGGKRSAPTISHIETRTVMVGSWRKLRAIPDAT